MATAPSPASSPVTFSSPRWLRIAYKYDGLKETKGPKHNGTILGWLTSLEAWWYEDETPWCGTFVAIVMKEAHMEYPKLYMRAKAWLDWGRRISKPVLGCVVIFDRAGGGHVGFVVGRTLNGDLLVYGGNQRDAVCVSQFSPARVVGYRIPTGWNYAEAHAAPLRAVAQERSINEA